MSVLDGPLAKLREDEIRLLNEIATTLAELGASVAEDRQRILDMAQDLRDMFFMVVVIGEFNAGKSTFVNAMLGDKLLPMGITPTTEYIELVRYNEVPDRKPEIRDDGIRAWAHPNTGIPGVAIVDTPGTGSVFQKHEKTAKSFLHRSDLVIFVISAKRALAETERLYLELAKNYGKKIILVMNQIDLLEPSELAQVRQFIESQVKELLDLDALLFTVSAKDALDAQTGDAPEEPGADPGGIGAVRAHLRGVYNEAPPAKQKLLAQLDTSGRVIKNNLDMLKGKADLVTADIGKVRGVQQELQQQSMGLEAQMKSSRAEIDQVLEGVRRRGISFIENNLSLRKLGRVDRNKLQNEFQDVVIGRSLRDINEAAGNYVNAVIDHSRLYWRGVIERLNQLQDLMEQELTGLDATVYAEQREGLQRAIRIAEAELKTYSTGEVVGDMQSTFQANMTGLWRSGLVTVSGVVAMIVAAATPGPLLGTAAGVAAAPLAFPVFIAGAVATAVFSIPTIRYINRVTRETKNTFNQRIDQLLETYHKSLDELTGKERARLTQYGNQVLTPVFSRLESLAKRYSDQQSILRKYQEQIDGLRKKIDSAS